MRSSHINPSSNVNQSSHVNPSSNINPSHTIRSRHLTRRGFLTGAAVGGGVLLAGFGAPAFAQENPQASQATPAEDLMYEHGVIERMLLVYTEAARRIEAKEEAPLSAIAATAELSRNFTDNYHHAVEEEFVFGTMAAEGRQIDLINVLSIQHGMGEDAVSLILDLSTAGKMSDFPRLARAMRDYSRMYAAHAAFENSILFKEFQEMLPAEEYAQIGKDMMDREREILGENGYQQALGTIAQIERQLGLDNLELYTIKA